MSQYIPNLEDSHIDFSSWVILENETWIPLLKFSELLEKVEVNYQVKKVSDRNTLDYSDYLDIYTEWFLKTLNLPKRQQMVFSIIMNEIIKNFFFDEIINNGWSNNNFIDWLRAYLDKFEPKGYTQTFISNKLNCNQNDISQHMKILERKWLIKLWSVDWSLKYYNITDNDLIWFYIMRKY